MIWRVPLLLSPLFFFALHLKKKKKKSSELNIINTYMVLAGYKSAFTCVETWKGTPSENASWAENVVNIQVFPYAGFVWFYQYLYVTEVLFCFELQLL